jgi:hypothetical protein
MIPQNRRAGLLAGHWALSSWAAAVPLFVFVCCLGGREPRFCDAYVLHTCLRALLGRSQRVKSESSEAGGPKQNSESTANPGACSFKNGDANLWSGQEQGALLISGALPKIYRARIACGVLGGHLDDKWGSTGYLKCL